MSIIDYSHNRDSDFKESSDELFELIEEFVEEEKLESFFNHYESRYSIPIGVLKQSLKKNIIRHYRYRSARFGEKLRLRTLPLSIVKNIGFLLLSLIYSRKKRYNKHYKLIVDEIDQNVYLERFSKLINLFNKDDVLVIATADIDQEKFPDYNIKRLKLYKYHDLIEVIKIIYYELCFGFWICLKTSFQLRINLFEQSKVIIATLIRYKSLFKECSADYLLQERLYTTNAIKNHLFIKSGGSATSTMQKSILELDQMSYYIDIDYFFSLGEITAERAFEYGGRIDKVIPVGSYFMGYYWFNKPRHNKKNIDVLMLGINTMNAYERLDKYTEFMDDYYKSIRWLVKFKKENPSYRIGIKHHSSAGNDIIENKIILNSGVEILPKEQNSYELAFESRCIITWGSTMGYEMNAHGVPSFFLDPGKRNTFLYDLRNKNFQHILLDNYDDYQNYLVSTIDGLINKDYGENLSKNLCLDSYNVSKKIYKTFCN